MLRMSNAFWSQAKRSDFEKLDLSGAAHACGMIRQAESGLWELDCFGAALAARLDARLRRLMSGLGAHEIRLNLMQGQDLWEKTGRDRAYGEELYDLTDRRGKRMRLAATAEEAACRGASMILAGSGRSVWGYQIGAKWRDETRARGALARSREFSMLDAYSFCQDLDEARSVHQACLAATLAEFKSLGLAAHARLADCGEVGGLESVEIEIDSAFLGDAQGKLELAHLFLLGQTYSKAFGLMSKSGEAMQMGCQGIGASRLLMALLESRRSSTGFQGDQSACSHLIWLCALDQSNTQAREASEQLAAWAGPDGILDDRDLSAGRKLREAEAAMAAYRIVASSRSIARGGVEIKAMDGSFERDASLGEAKAFIQERRAMAAGLL